MILFVRIEKSALTTLLLTTFSVFCFVLDIVSAHWYDISFECRQFIIVLTNANCLGQYLSVFSLFQSPFHSFCLSLSLFFSVFSTQSLCVCISFSFIIFECKRDTCWKCVLNQSSDTIYLVCINAPYIIHIFSRLLSAIHCEISTSKRFFFLIFKSFFRLTKVYFFSSFSFSHRFQCKLVSMIRSW